MATHPAANGPIPAQSSATSTTTPQELQNALDNSIWYLLALWHPLHIAVTSLWGGPDSSDKRDWFAGAVSDLLTARPDTDPDELEAFLLQIMQDEFDCNVEDESEVIVARDILAVRARMMEERTVAAARDVEQRWKNRGTMKGDVQVQVVEHDVGQEEWDALGEEDEDEDGDEDMVEAPQLVSVAPAKQKQPPQVDDDGFTKVVGKKKR